MGRTCKIFPIVKQVLLAVCKGKHCHCGEPQLMLMAIKLLTNYNLPDYRGCCIKKCDPISCSDKMKIIQLLAL